MHIDEIHSERQRELYRELNDLGIPGAYIGNPHPNAVEDGWSGALAVGWAEAPDYIPCGPELMLIMRMPDGSYLREASGRRSDTPQSFDTLRAALTRVGGTNFSDGGMYAVVASHEPGRLAREEAVRERARQEAEDPEAFNS